MKLTVGPLPPAVYWRRRAVVLGVLLLVVILLMYSCSGSDSPSAAQNSAAQDVAAATDQPTAVGQKSPTLLNPAAGDVPSPGGTSQPPADAPVSTGPCADEEMQLTVVPEVATVRRGTPIKITFKIRNMSSRACSRDVGADAQEIYVVDGAGGKVWSSDFCGAERGEDVRTFGPGIETEFFVTWTGNQARSRATCSTTLVRVGSYRVVGRLAGKLSDPVALQVSA